jgi:hypothetical protein
MTLLKTLAAATKKPSAIANQLRAAREFIRAFPAEAYRIQIVDRLDESGKRNIEPVTADDLLEHVRNGTLARANVNNACIFARPIRRDLLLIDDLSPHSIPALTREGFAPLAVIQSSQKKTNCVIRIPSIGNDDVMLHRVAQKLIVQHLIDRGFAADIAAAHDLQVWRLPGFSNQKRNDDGTQKYTPTFFAKFLSIDPDVVAERGEEFAQRAREIIECGGDENEITPAAPRKSAEIKTQKKEYLGERVIYSPGKYIATILDTVRDPTEGKPNKKGGRNQALYEASFTLFQLSAGAVGDASASRIFDVEFLERALANASSAAGLDEAEIESTIMSAMRAAAGKPVRPIIAGV